jgi:DNA-binding transcriptional MerR regulator
MSLSGSQASRFDQAVSPKDAAAQYGGDCHPRTLKRWEREAKFPPSIKLSERRRAYRRSDLEQWLADKATGGL